ncbi:MAG: lyase family protein [Planctomycetota bacterium]
MTTNANDTYTSPLASRNASPEMLKIWSPRHKFNTWRRIWLAIAEAQHEVTKDRDTPLVSKEQVEELRAVVERGITDEELARASEIERDLRHDVMAHVHCLGESCPKAKPIIHLGCTSQDVVCNADLLAIHASVMLIEKKRERAVAALGVEADKHKHVPTLGFTHYQTAQPVTVGRRLVGYASELCEVEETLHLYPVTVMLRGFRGATGTQASFLQLLGSHEAVESFEARAIARLLPSDPDVDDLRDIVVADNDAQLLAERDRRAARQRQYGNVAGAERWEAMSVEELRAHAFQTIIEYRSFPLTGQTYPRSFDARVLAGLANLAAVLHKIATDIRLLSNRKEIDEPFGKNQIGSSAMPYKRNPMKCERICGLTRFVMNLVGNAYDTAATQWLERTLDDSSNRRLSLPEAFLALDGALDLMHQVASGLVVNEAMVRKNLMAELPFLATENILMEAVKAGGDRQDLHEKIRVHAQAAGHRVKQEGLDNDLIEWLRGDPAFAPVAHLLTEDALLDPMKYVGRSVEQTERFIAEVVEPLRERYADELASLGGSDRGV